MNSEEFIWVGKSSIKVGERWEGRHQDASGAAKLYSIAAGGCPIRGGCNQITPLGASRWRPSVAAGAPRAVKMFA